MRSSRVSLTRWWHKYIDGANPDDPPRRQLAEYFRKTNIDPYKLPKELYDDYRRYYLTEMNWFTQGKQEEAWHNVVQKRRHEIFDLKHQYPLETSLRNTETFISGNFLRIRTSAPLGHVVTSSSGVRGVVTSFDASTVTLMKIPSTYTEHISFSLATNKRLADSTSYRLRDDLVDVACVLKSGSVVAMTTPASPHQRRKFSDQFASFRASQGDKVLRTRISESSNDAQLFLEFLRVSQTAVELHHTSPVTLVLEDLEDYQEAFNRLQVEARTALPVSFVQALNAALNVAGGRLTVVAFVASSEDFGSALGQTADHILALDPHGQVELGSALLLPKKIGQVGSLAERLLAQEVRDLLTQGHAMQENLGLRRELKIHEDFWDTEELDNFNTQLAVLRKSQGDLFVVRAAMKFFFLGKKIEVFKIDKFVKEVAEFMRVNEPDLVALSERVGGLDDRDEVQDVFDKIDRALMRHRMKFELAIPRL